MVKLLNLEEMPWVDGMDTPSEIYTVIDEPALLAGMRYPGMEMPWDKLREAGFTGIVCLTSTDPLYTQSEIPGVLPVLHATKLQDLYGRDPYDPDEQEKLVRDATRAVVNGLHRGENVVVHCLGGTGRTGTVIGCVLRELGVPAKTVLKYLNDINVVRGVGGWPENEWQAEMVRKY